MSLVNVDRLERMHDLICRKATGTPDDFAEKLGISKSMLMLNLAQLKEKGGPIKYDSLNRTYYYTCPCRFIIGYELDKEVMGKVRGGRNILKNFTIPILFELDFTFLGRRAFASLPRIPKSE